VAKEQLQDNPSYLSNLDNQSWKLFLDDETVDTGEAGAGRTSEPVPIMGPMAISHAWSGLRFENSAMDKGFPSKDAQKVEDIKKALSGLSVNGHMLTRDESALSAASNKRGTETGFRQQTSNKQMPGPRRAIIAKETRQTSRPPGPSTIQTKKITCMPIHQIERNVPLESAEHITKERDDTKREGEILRKTVSASKYGGGEGEKEVNMDLKKALAMNFWQPRVHEEDTMPSTFIDAEGRRSTHDGAARNRGSTVYVYPYESAGGRRKGQVSPLRVFRNAACRLFEATSPANGKLSCGQLIAALEHQPGLAEALGFPANTYWDFVVGYCFADSSDISLAEFIDKLPVLRGAAHYEITLEEPRVAVRPGRGIASTSIDATVQQNNSKPSPRHRALALARLRSVTSSVCRSPQMSSSTREKINPDLSSRSRSYEFWAAQCLEEQRIVAEL